MYHLTATTISKSLVIEKINLENLFIPWYSWNTANVGINQSINQSNELWSPVEILWCMWYDEPQWNL